MSAGEGLRGEVGEDGCSPPIPHVEVGDCNNDGFHQSARFLVMMINMKNGTPTREVTIPMGMANPGVMMRLTACAVDIMSAPDARDAGMK